MDIGKYDWKKSVFHDGSRNFVFPANPKKGENIHIHIQMLKNSPIVQIFFSFFQDGEEINIEMQKKTILKRNNSLINNHSQNLQIYSTNIELQCCELKYRFRILTKQEHFWYSGLGITRISPPDEYSFTIIADAQIPSWVTKTVFYQIFPDRFCNGNPYIDVKDNEICRGNEKSVHCEWNEIPGEYGKNYTSLHFYGGDLAGIKEKISYLQDLGINGIYLNPIFMANSNHRYDTIDYYRIDPHIGTNEEFAQLVQDLHDQGIQIILDAVINHTGDKHPWFNRNGDPNKGGAYTSPNDPHRSFYRFYNEDPESFDAWKNYKLLPRLNYNSDKLKDQIYRKSDSVLKFWMKAPYNIDGWRFDCANMVGKYDSLGKKINIWEEIRVQLKEVNPNSFIIGESFYDGAELVNHHKLDAITNYCGFYSPLIRWLTQNDGIQALSNKEFRCFSFSYYFSLSDMITQMKIYRNKLPFQFQLIQINLLDSHDVPRLFSAIGKNESIMKMAVCFLFTYIGIPMIYYGDENGMEGISDPANRQPMIWEKSRWNSNLRQFYKKMIFLRKEYSELQIGSFFNFQFDTNDSSENEDSYSEILAFARFSKSRCLIIILQKKKVEKQIQIPLWQLGYDSGVIKPLLDLIKQKEINQSFKVNTKFSQGIAIFHAENIYPCYIGEINN
ncbi:alpha-amylase family glycosyl hydrolase [Candidatus Harpocratesius sp.]